MGHKYGILSTPLVIISLGAGLSACASTSRKAPADNPAPAQTPVAQEAATASAAPAAPTAPTAPAAEAPTAAAPAQAPAAPPAQAQISELQTTVHTLNAKVEALEMQLANVTDKLDAARSALDTYAREQKPKTAPVVRHPGEGSGTRVNPTPVKTDPETGFVNDDPVQEFRKAMILVKTRKYPEAVLAFSAFLERYPDHPLAGSAQYHVGEAYFLQKEYKLALHEYQRVLTSYDRSSHVARTLHEMALAEDKLRKTEDAARHRQLLMSLFPHSPFAVAAAETTTEATESPASPTSPTAHSATDPTPPTVPLEKSETR